MNFFSDLKIWLKDVKDLFTKSNAFDKQVEFIKKFTDSIYLTNPTNIELSDTNYYTFKLLYVYSIKKADVSLNIIQGEDKYEITIPSFLLSGLNKTTFLNWNININYPLSKSNNTLNIIPSSDIDIIYVIKQSNVSVNIENLLLEKRFT